MSAYAKRGVHELVVRQERAILAMRSRATPAASLLRLWWDFQDMAQEEKGESLDTEVEQALEEARMVLPGIQALFGFQLIAVFNQRFAEALGDSWQLLHLAAVVLTAVAVGLIMAPAAYHRQAEPDRASRYFANYASLVITLAMAPLALALAVEVSVVAFVVTKQAMASALIGVTLALFLVWLWYAFPAYRKRHRVTPSRARRRASRLTS